MQQNFRVGWGNRSVIILGTLPVILTVLCFTRDTGETETVKDNACCYC